MCRLCCALTARSRRAAVVGGAGRRTASCWQMRMMAAWGFAVGRSWAPWPAGGGAGPLGRSIQGLWEQQRFGLFLFLSPTLKNRKALPAAYSLRELAKALPINACTRRTRPTALVPVSLAWS